MPKIDRLDPSDVRLGDTEPEARALDRRGRVAGHQRRPEILQHVGHIGSGRADQSFGTGYRGLQRGLIAESCGRWPPPAPHHLLGGQGKQRLDRPARNAERQGGVAEEIQPAEGLQRLSALDRRMG